MARAHVAPLGVRLLLASAFGRNERATLRLSRRSIHRSSSVAVEVVLDIDFAPVAHLA